MMTGHCFFCQRVDKLHVHHIVGRIDGTPIHEGLVVRACEPCNTAQFLLWKYARLDSRHPTKATKLRRAAVFLSIRNSDLDAELADYLTTLAEELETELEMPA